MGIQGTVGDLKVVLSSEPDMSHADMVSYLAVGRPAGQALSLGGSGGSGNGGGGLLASGAGLALDPAAGLLEGLAADHIGLDVIDIRRDGVRGTSVVAGRYVSPTLYLGFRQSLTQPRANTSGTGQASPTSVEIEVAFYRWLLLNFESGGDALQFFLKARHGY
jgi:autotransporter translocation and assembly factor TamB